jgi:CRISP-associated protein Cas1
MHTLAISEQGTTVHAEGDMLVLRRGSTVLRRVRAGELEQVLLFGGVEVTTRAMALLLRREIDLVLLMQSGKFRGRLSGRGAKNVLLRLAQYRCSTDGEFCVRAARAIVTGKLRNQRQNLLRAQRQLQDNDLAAVLGKLRVLGERAAACSDLDVLRGFEGQAAALYFGQLSKLIRNPAFSFTARTRRLPRDPVNALLSFGYAVFGSLAETEVYRCGLDPMLGFLHQPAYGRPSLMLDLLEEFRPLIDLLVLRVVNRRQVSAQDFEQRGEQTAEEILAESAPGGEPRAGDEADPWDLPWDLPVGSSPVPPPGTEPPIEPCEGENGSDLPAVIPWPGATGGGGEAAGSCGGHGLDDAGGPPVRPSASSEPVVGVYLNDLGRKVFLNELFRRQRERLYYPRRAATLELRDILRQQIYHMARVIEGKDETYVPFAPD